VRNFAIDDVFGVRMGVSGRGSAGVILGLNW
jgi:hypothetical protein